MPADALLEAAWEGVPREAAARSLAVRVANLRAFLEPGRDRGAPSSLLVRDGVGYRLAVAPEQVDAHRFERCVRAAAALPPAAALEALDGALALWRGTPFGDLADAELARAEIRRLEDLRTRPRRRAPARSWSSAGRSRRSPTCAGWWPPTRCARSSSRTLMLALFAAGRQVEALAVYRELAARLRELGLAPGARDARAGAAHPRARRGARRAGAAAAPARGARRPAPVGREPELARLRAALAAAVAGAAPA